MPIYQVVIVSSVLTWIDIEANNPLLDLYILFEFSFTELMKDCCKGELALSGREFAVSRRGNFRRFTSTFGNVP